MISDALLKSIRKSYGRKSNILDITEYLVRRLREVFFAVDYRIFDKTIRYYSEKYGENISREDALSRALNKEQHKKAWYDKPRNSIDDIMHFYQEVHVYPFRQPYLKRFGGYRWYINLVKHIRQPSILEYGCGSAVLTEYFLERFPHLKYSVADIPSTTLDFVQWKKVTYGFKYDILTIGAGREGIPLRDNYDLIICQDVLEHTPNPLDIVSAFVDHLSPCGVLVVDFIDAPGGENLEVAIEQREPVKQYLKDKLIPAKEIDKPTGNYGLYIKY